MEEEKKGLTKEQKELRRSLIDTAIGYMASEAGKKALGVGIDIDTNSIKEEAKRIKEERKRIKKDLKEGKITEEEAKEQEEEVKSKLFDYIPKFKEFSIEGRLYDEITSTPIEGAKVEPILAFGKKAFTDSKGEFNITVDIPILPYNNKALVQSKFVYTKKGYIPAYSEVLTLQREVKSDLKTVPLINTELASEQASDDAEQQLYDQIETAAKFAYTLSEKVLMVRAKQIGKLTAIVLGTLLPLGISLLLLFGITKISDLDKAICPTKEQLAEAAKKRNQIAKRINQLYGIVAINVILAALFTYIAMQLRKVKGQIAGLSFPVAVPPGTGVPYSLISALEEVKKLLDRFIQENKNLNIALIIALIFFVVALIIISLILKAIDKLIFRCAPETLPLVELNQELQDLLDLEGPTEEQKQLINGFEIEVIELDKNSVEGFKRRQAVGKNQRGTILVRGDESFSSSDQVLKDELAFYIKSNDLKAY